MEDGTTAYDVTYQDGVTVVSKDDTMRHLVTIHQDGSYVFDSSASQIANLKPGSVLLLSGLALCTVVDVQKTDDGYSLKTGPAKITDAIKDGRLEGTYKIDFSRMQGEEILLHAGVASIQVLSLRHCLCRRLPDDRCAGRG